MFGGEADRLLIQETSKLVLNPSTRNARLRAVEALVLYALLVDNVPSRTIESIREVLSERLGLRDVPGVLLEQALRKLEGEGMLSGRDESWVIVTEKLGSLRESTRKTGSGLEALTADFVGCVENRFGKLDEHQRVFARKVFQISLFEIIKALGDSAVSFLTGKQVDVRESDLLAAFDKAKMEIKEPVVERAEEVRDAIYKAFFDVFTEPSRAFSSGLAHVVTNYVMLRVLTVDPELRRFESRFFKEVRLALDTNVLIGLICRASSRHSFTKWLLEASVSLGVEFFVCEETLQELSRSVDFAGKVYAKNHGQRLSAEVLENEIIRTYWRYYATSLSWDEFAESLEEGRLEAFSRHRVKQLEPDFEIDPNSLVDAVRVVQQETSHALVVKPASLIEHDAYCLLAVQEMREDGPGGFSSPWFLTYDYKLRRADKRIRNRCGFAYESSMSPDAWLEIIHPFLAADVDTSEVADVFVRMLGASLLPLPASTVREFLEYVGHEIGVEADDIEALYKYIEKTHLFNALQRAVEQSDIPEAFDKLYDAIGEALKTGMDVEAARQTIGRLSEKNSELTARVKELETTFRIDRDRYAGMLSGLDQDAGSFEKGSSLEQLAVYLLECVKGWKVVERNKRTKTSELDLLIENANQTEPFLRELGSDIPVECKNWKEPVGASEIRDFGHDLRKRRFVYGVLISNEGITGDEHRKTDAKGELWNFFSKDGVSILVLSRGDLERIAEGMSLVSILREKARAIKLFG